MVFQQAQASSLVSIIIPSYNRKDELMICLNSILKQDYQNIEIIVVDDNSSDGTVQMVQRQFPQIQIIMDSVNFGPSYRRNQGILASQGEYLLFLDTDVELQEPSIVSRMVERLQKDNTIGEIGGEIAVYDGETKRVFGRNISYTGHSYRIPALDGDSQLTPCDYLATCNCMVRKDVAIKSGGFDPYYEFGSEDTDFGFAIQKQGYRNFVGFPYAVHHKRVMTTGRHSDETYRYRVTRIRFLLKHYGLDRVFLLFLIDLIRIIIFYPILPFKVIAKLLLRKSVKRESFTGGWLIIKAYIWNIRHFRETLSAKTANFLSSDKMEQFRREKGQLS